MQELNSIAVLREDYTSIFGAFVEINCLSMTPLSTIRSNSSIPLTWRTLLLATAFFACLLLNADYARGQTPPDDPPPDDHGDEPATATLAPLGYLVEGSIDPADDIDYFALDLSDQTAPTDVWIYTTGGLDTIGELRDEDNDLIVSNDDRIISLLTNFSIRAVLEPGIYFVTVGSWDQRYVGDYTLFLRAVTANPSDSIDQPSELLLNALTPARLDTRRKSHYFQFDFTEHSYLSVLAEVPVLVDSDEDLVSSATLEATVYDAEGEEVPVNIRSFDGADFYIRDDFAPGTYLLEVTTPPDDYENAFPAYYYIRAWLDTIYPQFLSACGDFTNSVYGPTVDPLIACQWHLRQPNGEDVNVLPAWNQGYLGEGINIAVVDDGMDWAHEDLIDNVDASLNHDYSGEGDIHYRYAHHGTAVAGLIAARDNDIGVRGVAPRATIYGYNLLRGLALAETMNVETARIADAAGRNAEITSISNNSWGFTDRGAPRLPSALWEYAVENSASTGNDGKGVLYVWAAGNGHQRGDDANLDGRANFYPIIAACAVSGQGVRSSYSEMGANLWVCGQGGDFVPGDDLLTVTTENSDRYRDTFNGTSSAAPIVSGVAALVREANPDLTWRDVKLVLAESARRNDPDNEGWEVGARTYGSTSDSDRYHFNHEYGFGVVDAAAAVELAKTWTNLPPMREASIESAKIDRLIPDAYDAASIETVALTLTLDLDTDLDFTEFVEINTSFQHNSFRDLDIELESPSGAISKLVPAFDTFIDDDDPDNDFVPLRGPHRFGSARHLGEDPNGTWTLRITDRFRFGTGILESWGITVYGHSFAEVDNAAPIFADGETTSRSVPENTPAGSLVGDPVTAADPEALTYTLGGPDMALFSIDSASGQIAVGSGTSLDYEVRTGYAVIVTATDPRGASDIITVDIDVTDVSLGELGDRYDADHNEKITRDEVILAIQDYLTGLISRDEVLEIINLFFFD